nr:hypothetical protein [Fodinicola acaciae]
MATCPLCSNETAGASATPSGIADVTVAGTTAYSAYAPLNATETTRWPIRQRSTSGPTATIVPATSPPGATGHGPVATRVPRADGNETPAAETFTRISPGPGRGRGTSSNCSTSGPPPR